MAFARITFRESLRDIEACLRSQQSKLYHMGIRSRVSRNTLANANKVRAWRIYADFAQKLISTRPQIVSGRRFRLGAAKKHGLRPGRVNHRSLSERVSLGPIPENKGGNQTSNSFGPSREYSDIYSHNRRKGARCQCPGCPPHGTGKLLCHGSSISGFLQAPHNASKQRLFPHTVQIEHEISKDLFESERQRVRIDLRANNTSDRNRLFERLSGKAAADQAFRFGIRKMIRVFNQQPKPARIDNRRTLPVPLAGGTLFQMEPKITRDPKYRKIVRRFKELSDGTKIKVKSKLRMLAILAEAPDCPTRILIEKTAEIEGRFTATVRQVNRLRLQWGLNRSRGRPRNPTDEDANGRRSCACWQE